MEKRAAICVGEEIRDVLVQPGMTASDVLAAAGLPRTHWLSDAGGLKYGADEPIWDRLRDGSKLFASASVDVGRVLATLEAVPWAS